MSTITHTERAAALLDTVFGATWRGLLAGVALTDLLEKSLSIALLLLTIGYTLWKWRREARKAEEV